MKKNVAGQSIGAEMVTAADGTAFTGAVTVYYTIDNGAQTIGSVGSGVCTHEGNGYHSYAPAQGETNGDHIAWTFIGTGAVPATIQVYTGFPQSVDNDVKLTATALEATSQSILAGQAGQALETTSQSILSGQAAQALETTSQEILAQVTGTGNRLVTIHVQDTVAAPIADVLVRIGTASVTTDTNGDALFALDDGDYAPVLRKDFVTFTVPEALTVAGDGTHPYTGTVFAPSVPTQPDTCVVYGIVTDNGGAPVAGTDIFINTVDKATFAGELKIVKNQETTSAADGTWQLELIRNTALTPGTAYQVIMCDVSFKYKTTITVPDQDSVEFSTIKGT